MRVLLIALLAAISYAQTDYVFGEMGVRGCPCGYAPITDEEECRQVVESRGVPIFDSYKGDQCGGAPGCFCNGRWCEGSCIDASFSNNLRDEGKAICRNVTEEICPENWVRVGDKCYSPQMQAAPYATGSFNTRDNDTSCDGIDEYCTDMNMIARLSSASELEEYINAGNTPISRFGLSSTKDVNSTHSYYHDRWMSNTIGGQTTYDFVKSGCDESDRWFVCVKEACLGCVHTGCNNGGTCNRGKDGIGTCNCDPRFAGEVCENQIAMCSFILPTGVIPKIYPDRPVCFVQDGVKRCPSGSQNCFLHDGFLHSKGRGAAYCNIGCEEAPSFTLEMRCEAEGIWWATYRGAGNYVVKDYVIPSPQNITSRCAEEALLEKQKLDECSGSVCNSGICGYQGFSLAECSRQAKALGLTEEDAKRPAYGNEERPKGCTISKSGDLWYDDTGMVSNAECSEEYKCICLNILNGTANSKAIAGFAATLAFFVCLFQLL